MLGCGEGEGEGEECLVGGIGEVVVGISGKVVSTNEAALFAPLVLVGVVFTPSQSSKMFPPLGAVA
jgi:hypothetical protein